MYRVGIDVGGTNIAIGIIDEKYKMIDKISVKTAMVKEPEQMINAIAGSVREILDKNRIMDANVEAVGLGVPGTAELDTGRIMYANNLGFENIPFLPKLKDALGDNLGKKTCFDNDGNAAAIGEYITGKYNQNSFVMVTLGTGIGGGIIIDGKLLRGLNYAAAEFGHLTINVDGCQCNCGRRGCFENYASATALISQARDVMAKDVYKESALWSKCGNLQEIDGEKFFAAVKEKDELAIKVLDRFTTYLAEGLIDIINILQPEVLVLSGGITRAADLYIEAVKEKVKRGVYSRNSEKNTKIMIAHGIPDAGDVGIIGAALIDKG